MNNFKLFTLILLSIALFSCNQEPEEILTPPPVYESPPEEPDHTVGNISQVINPVPVNEDSVWIFSHSFTSPLFNELLSPAINGEGWEYQPHELIFRHDTLFHSIFYKKEIVRQAAPNTIILDTVRYYHAYHFSRDNSKLAIKFYWTHRSDSYLHKKDLYAHISAPIPPTDPNFLMDMYSTLIDKEQGIMKHGKNISDTSFVFLLLNKL